MSKSNFYGFLLFNGFSIESTFFASFCRCRGLIVFRPRLFHVFFFISNVCVCVSFSVPICPTDGPDCLCIFVSMLCFWVLAQRGFLFNKNHSVSILAAMVLSLKDKIQHAFKHISGIFWSSLNEFNPPPLSHTHTPHTFWKLHLKLFLLLFPVVCSSVVKQRRRK